jgi:hypothetical protein
MFFTTKVLDTIFEVDGYSKLHKITTPKTTQTDGWEYVFVFIISNFLVLRHFEWLFEIKTLVFVSNNCIEKS